MTREIGYHPKNDLSHESKMTSGSDDQWGWILNIIEKNIYLVDSWTTGNTIEWVKCKVTDNGDSVIDDMVKEIEYWEQFVATWESDDTREAGNFSGSSNPPNPPYMNLLLETAGALYVAILHNPSSIALQLFEFSLSPSPQYNNSNFKF